MKRILVLNEDQEVELLHDILTYDSDRNNIVSRVLSVEEAIQMFEANCEIELRVMDPYGQALFLEKQAGSTFCAPALLLKAFYIIQNHEL